MVIRRSTCGDVLEELVRGVVRVATVAEHENPAIYEAEEHEAGNVRLAQSEVVANRAGRLVDCAGDALLIFMALALFDLVADQLPQASRPRAIIRLRQEKPWCTDAIPFLLRIHHPRINSWPLFLSPSGHRHEQIVPCYIVDAAAFAHEVIDSVEAVTDSVDAFTDPAWDFGLTVMPVGDALSPEQHP